MPRLSTPTLLKSRKIPREVDIELSFCSFDLCYTNPIKEQKHTYRSNNMSIYSFHIIRIRMMLKQVETQKGCLTYLQCDLDRIK
jgi:hypothetical protein